MSLYKKWGSGSVGFGGLVRGHRNVLVMSVFSWLWEGEAGSRLVCF